MKQIILALSLIFLCSVQSTAQKTISKEDFENLVDYANCKYVMTFIEENDGGKPYFEDTYKKKVKPEMEKVTLDNFETILNYQKLVELLSNNIPALELAKKINNRKLKFDELQDNESLINSLGTTGWKNIDLSMTAANIQNEILTKYKLANGEKSIMNVSESEIVKAQTIQTSTQVEELYLKLDELQQQYDNLKNDTKIIEYQKSFKNFKLIIYSLFGLLAVLVVAIYLLLISGNLREYIIKQVSGSQRIAKKFTSMDNYPPNNETKPYNLTEKDINTIADRVLECKQLNEKEIQQQSITMIKGSFDLSKSATKYLKGKSGKIFNRVENTPDNSFFKLLNESDENAQFEFCGDEAEAIAKRIFSKDICTIVSGSYQNAHSIDTRKPGKVKRVGEQWEVIDPIQINLV